MYILILPVYFCAGEVIFEGCVPTKEIAFPRASYALSPEEKKKREVRQQQEVAAPSQSF